MVADPMVPVPIPSSTSTVATSRRPSLRSFARNRDGFTAVEFAIVAIPFIMMLFGIIAVGLFFFTTFALENAIEQSSRLLRTGQVQESGMTREQFKTEVCNRAPGFVDCTSKLRVNVQSFASFGAIAAASCTDGGGNLISEGGSSFTPGGSSDVVLVTVCYEWDLVKAIPFIQLGNMGSGGRLIQAATTFRTEPYQN
jgi:Flp pilus assembly protein TadG